MKKLLLAIAAASLLFAGGSCFAQTSGAPTPPANCSNLSDGVIRDGKTNCNNFLVVNSDGSINVSGTISASSAAFTPTSATSNATLSATTSSQSTAVPTGLTQVVQNTGSNVAYIDFSIGAGTATTAAFPVQGGSTVVFAISSQDHINYLTSTSTTTLLVSGGSGVPALAGGAGGGGGGGGGVVTQATPANLQTLANATATSAAPTYTTATNNALSADVHGQNRSLIGDTTGTPVDFTAASAVTQSGTWTVQPGNTANTTAWKVDGSAVTQPVSSATLATAANQTTAAAQASTTSGQTGPLVQGAVTTAAPSYTTAETSPLSLDTAGNLRVNVVTGSSSGAVAQGSTTAGQSGLPVMCATTTNSPSYTTLQTNLFSCDISGNIRVQTVVGASGPNGGLTAGGDASTNAKVGYVFHNYNYTFNGTAWDRNRDILGSISAAGVGIQAVEEGPQLFSNITTATTTTVKSGAGILHKIVINTTVASATITVYDNTAGSGTKIATITLPSTITSDMPATLTYDSAFATGLTIVTSGATDLTITYR